MWQTLLRRKYLKNKPLGAVNRKPRDSHFWSGLMNVKDRVLGWGTFQVRNGKDIRFWEDKWLGNFTLKDRYPPLYNIVRKKHDSVAMVCRSVPLNVSFRRSLQGINRDLWFQLVGLLVDINITDEQDAFTWDLQTNKQFTVRSMYNALISNGQVVHDKTIWKTKLPLKIKIFLWYLKKGVVLTKDNLIRRRWKGAKKCEFCAMDETIQHLFFDCHIARFIWRAIMVVFNIKMPHSFNNMFGLWLFNIPKHFRELLLVGMAAMCWSIWLSRNDLVFEKKQSTSYLQVLFRGTYWCRQWTLLQKKHEDSIILKEACTRLEMAALSFFKTYGWLHPKRIQN